MQWSAPELGIVVKMLMPCTVHPHNGTDAVQVVKMDLAFAFLLD
jgi:hypothetical protein